MRMMGRLLIALLLLTLLAFGGYAIYSSLSQLEKRDVQPWEDDYERAIVYMLQPGETLNFDVPNNATQLRILHTPVGVPEADEPAELRFAAAPDDSLSQSYQITLQGESQPTTDSQLPPRFFDTPTGTRAGLTQVHIVSFDGRQKLTEFSLTLTSSPRPLAIRVAVLESYTESVVSRLWQRLNADQKAALFEDHIYPVELVPEDERTARLKERWRPIGPVSASDGKVVSRALFVNRSASADNEAPRVVDELAVIGPQRWFTLDTARQPEITSFRCTGLEYGDNVQVSLSTVDQSTVEQSTVDQSMGRGALPAAPGLYRLMADQRCELTFFNQQGETVVADYNYLRGTIAAYVDPLYFALVAESKQVQPLRIDARLVTAEGSSLPDDLVVHWRINDQAGDQLLKGKLTPATDVNPYQVTVDASLTNSVHHKSSRYVVAPATASRLSVWLASPQPVEGVEVLINVYTRPADLPYRVEQTDEDEPQQQLIPKWFLSRAVTPAAGVPPATRLLSWQIPLPEAAPVQQAETEQWYSLKSLDQAPYFELFMPADEDRTQDTAANLLYYPISPASADGTDYQLSTPEHDQEVRPQLVYQKANDEPLPIEIEVNGNRLRSDWLYADAGKLFLPSMAQGNYRLSITAPSPVRWFSNYQPTSDAQPYRVRSAYKLRKALTFEVQKKAAEEWVTFNYFPATAQSHQVTITVEKKDRVGVFADYTVSERTFPITAPAAPPVTEVLNQDQPALWQPIRLPFLLGRDLTNSSYRITVSSSVRNSGYIQAGYLAEAPLYQVEIYTEDGHAPF